jgi:hypothetical protein
VIKAIKAETTEDIKHLFTSLKYKSIPDEAMFIYGYWNEDKCVGVTYLSNNYPNYFTIELKNANSISIAKAIGSMLAQAVKLKSSLLAEVSKYNFKSLKLCKQLGFRIVYKSNETVTLEFRKEFWRYGKRWII